MPSVNVSSKFSICRGKKWIDKIRCCFDDFLDYILHATKIGGKSFMTLRFPGKFSRDQKMAGKFKIIFIFVGLSKK